jgi:hypothetical protein
MPTGKADAARLAILQKIVFKWWSWPPDQGVLLVRRHPRSRRRSFGAILIGLPTANLQNELTGRDVVPSDADCYSSTLTPKNA